MILYRIAKCIYAGDLSGTGARLYGGRWNSIGKPMVYLASSRSLAVLETLVHLSPTNVPADLCMAIVELPDDVEEINTEELTDNWQQYPGPNILKQTGDRFLKKQQRLLLKVPSAIVGEEYNYLLNPIHPKASAVKLLSKEPFSFDERISSR